MQDFVLGDGAVEMDFLSDPEVNFAHCARKELNYMNPNMVIASSIFVRIIEVLTTSFLFPERGHSRV